MERSGDLLSIIGVALITCVAALAYYKSGRIPNKLVFPAFLAGWVFRAVVHPDFDTVAGSMKDAGLAFAVGFGAMFVCFIFFGMGAGSVKLMGALSVWLGYKMTAAVTALSIVAGIAFCVAIVFAESRLQPGSPGDDDSANEHAELKENAPVSRRHLVLPFPYIIVAATWSVVIWFRFVR